MRFISATISTGTRINDILGKAGLSQTYIPTPTVMNNSKIDVNSVDGIPSAWKLKNGYKADDDLTKLDSDKDGYTDWEVWRILNFETK